MFDFKGENTKEIKKLASSMKDFVAQEYTSIQNNLAKDYELHYTKYQDLLFKVMEVENTFKQEKKVLQEHETKLTTVLQLLETYEEDKDHRDFFIAQQQSKEEQKNLNFLA